MTGKNWNYLRHWSGKAFSYDSRYGAYGSGNRVAGKKAARERASVIRRAGGLARITLERQDYGSYWVVWSHGKGGKGKAKSASEGGLGTTRQ